MSVFGFGVRRFLRLAHHKREKVTVEVRMIRNFEKQYQKHVYVICLKRMYDVSYSTGMSNVVRFLEFGQG